MPNRYWFKNMLGVHLTDFELLMIPNPRVELTVHVAIKTAQVGTLLGSLGGVIYRVLRSGGQADKSEIVDTATTSGLYGAAVGLLMGPVLTALTTKDKSLPEVYDRCYRLRFNKPILIADRMTILSACAGAAAFGPPGLVAGVDIGFLLGTYVGSKFK